MTTQASPRPELFVTWKDMYDRVEGFWTKPLQEMLATDTYVGTMANVRENILTQQSAAKEMMESHWETLRLPTKTDHARLAGQVVALEAKVDAAHDRLEGLEAKLDAILGKLNTLVPAADGDSGTGGGHEGEDTEGGKRRRK